MYILRHPKKHRTITVTDDQYNVNDYSMYEIVEYKTDKPKISRSRYSRMSEEEGEYNEDTSNKIET